MVKDLPLRQPSLADQVYEIILNGISDGSYPPGALLPSENQLAERFKVSRPTIRSAFARLEERGYIRRQRGVGTYVADFQGIVSPLYQLFDVPERIAARGMTPGFIQLDAVIIEADQKVSRKLAVEPGSLVLNSHKVFTADDKPIILFINYIPTSVFQDSLTMEQALEPGATEPFFEFFASQCNHPVKYLSSIIRPEIVENCRLPAPFEFEDRCTSFLMIEDIGYDSEDLPVFYSIEHLFAEASDFHLIRRVEFF